MDDDIYYDSDFDALALDSETPQDQETDEFGDDLDLTELEQQQLTTKTISGISFLPPDDTDAVPPPALPEHTPSFHQLHLESLRTWIYPTNYPIRGYQLNIVQKAMFHNTLVALPTGLGKTFIAAVVMYNYWRWFPNSKIIFMAPTRPLVTQQIEACFSICGLPQEDTTDMSGSVSPEKRIDLWKKKRVFFATPHVVYNDLMKNTCPGDKVVCIVVDEAHKATGNYSYVQVIRKIAKKNQQFRVLALTATPGSNLDTVQTVISNLHITNIQIRTEDSMDIQEFSYGKNIQSIIVPLGYTQGSTGILPRVVEEFKTQVFEPILLELSKLPTGVIPEAERNSAFGLQSSRTRFRLTSDNLSAGLKFIVIQKFLLAEQMSRAYDLLCQHGIAPFIESLESNLQELEGKKMNKSQAQFYNNNCIRRLIPKLKQDMQNPDFIGHPKLDKVVSILLNHFSDLQPGSSSKVMIFSSYRSSVTEICNVLNRHKPIIRCSIFVGQAEGKNGSKGLKQSEQQEVIQKFKSNEFNVLVSTSIGEEGLDIGEVDVIICYDSQSSPIRMLQRMGRTGRKRQGKCVLLMTESEERKFNQAKSTYANVQRLISQGVHLDYYNPNPTVIPPNYKPALCRKPLTVGQYQQKEKKKKRGAKNLVMANTDMTLEGLMKPHVEESFVRGFGLPQNTDLSHIFEKYWPKHSVKNSFSQHIPLQTKVRPTYRVGHSKRTHEFVDLVKKIEHRILNPDEEVTFTLPKQQTRLIMPSKVGNPNKLIINKRKKKRFDEFGDPVENNSLAHFLDPGASALVNNFGDGLFSDFEDDFAPSSSKKKVEDFFLPRKKTKIDHISRDKGKGKCIDKSASFSLDDVTKETDVPDVGPSTRNLDKSKIKEKEISFSLDDTISENEIPDLGTSRDSSTIKQTEDSSDSSRMKQTEDSDEFDDMKSWSSLLSDSIFEQVSPLKDMHALEPRNPPATDNQPSNPTILSSQPIDEITEINIADLYDQDSDDDFGDDDFPLDELFIKESEAWYDVRSKGFDDKLEPVFPFEKEECNLIDTFTFIWSDTTPKFSSKALTLLESRQQDVKKRFGRFITMSLFSKYSDTASPVIKLPPCEQQMVTSQHDIEEDEFGAIDDSLFEQVDALENQVQEKPISISSVSPEPEHLKEQIEDDVENVKEDGGFSDIDFEGNELVSFFQDNVENNVEEEGGFGNIDFEGNGFASIFQNNITEEEDDIIVYKVPSARNLRRKLEETKEKPNKKRKLTGLEENPFFDVEAEKSSDEGHTTDEDLESGSSAMRSFIDYEENSRSEGDRNVIYRLDSDDMPNNSRHWLNRFNAEKWLNPQEDSIVEEEEEEGESIIETSSNVFSSQVMENKVDDDDFM